MENENTKTEQKSFLEFTEVKDQVEKQDYQYHGNMGSIVSKKINNKTFCGTLMHMNQVSSVDLKP